jgi:predicted nucleotide-binding protein
MVKQQLPSVFIGSSSEDLEIAHEVELHLENDAFATIWKNWGFGFGDSTLESLMNAVEQFDFAIMILNPNDLLESRGQEYTSPRDNVIFELGLFMGRLGRNRVFILHEQDNDLKLPSDLLGITRATYRKREKMSDALSPACFRIIKSVRALGFFEGKQATQLSQATLQVEGVSERMMKLITLLVRSRTIELEITERAFGPLMSPDLMERIWLT